MRYTIIILLAITSLTSCTTLPTSLQLSPEDQQARIKQLAKTDTWKLQGRIGVISQKSSGSAKLYWEQNKEEFKLLILAPLGAKKLTISGNDQGIKVANSNGQIVESNDPDNTILAELGWPIPTMYLPFWIKGTPAPTTHFVYRKSVANTYSFSQADWDITYELSQDKSKTTSLPERITLINPIGKITIAVQKWDINGIKG